MYTVLRSDEFDKWLAQLKDVKGKSFSQDSGGITGMSTFAKFDAADYLDSEEMIAEYLTAALEDENPDVFLVVQQCCFDGFFTKHNPSKLVGRTTSRYC